LEEVMLGKRPLRGFVVGLLALLAMPRASEAVPYLSATVAACINGGCEFLPQEFGAGATTSILRTWQSPNQYLFQAEAALTLFDYDGFSAYSRASGDAHLQNGTSGAGGIASNSFGRAIIRDAITVAGPAGSGTFRLVWQITGSTEMGYSTTDLAQTNPLAGVQIGYECAAFTGAAGSFCGTGSFQYMANTVVDETLTFDVPITFNVAKEYQLTFTVGASTGTGNTFNFPLQFLGHAIGDFSSTGTLIDAAVFDAFGTPLDESGITSGAGFRYDLVGQAVPEPPLALVLGAALPLGALLRRRNRSAGAIGPIS
jgi:hypothetical protein